MKKLTMALALTTMASAAPAFANNITAATAQHLVADGTTQGHYVYAVGSAESSRWYTTLLRAGRSYSFHLLPGGSDSAAANSVLLAMNVVQSNGDTPLAVVVTAFHAPDSWTASDTTEEQFFGGPRASYTAAVDTVALIRVHDFGAYLPPGTFQYFRVSVTETTLYAPWFFSAGNYDAFAQIQNTSSELVDGILTFYSSVAATGGTTTVCGAPQAFTLPKFSSTFFQAKGTAGCVSAGSAKITFNGPPNSIHANVTSVNVIGTGLTHAFNVSFAPQSDRAGLQGSSNTN